MRIPGKSWSGKTEMSCRVFELKADELWTVTGKAARDFAQTLLKPGDICFVVSHYWDKFGGRFDGEVTMPNGEDFANQMIAAGHAVPYTP